MTDFPSFGNALLRWLPLVVLTGLAFFAYQFDVQNYASFQTIIENEETLMKFVGNHWAQALLIYAIIYVISVSLSLPGAGFLSVAGGFLFGWEWSAPVSVISATIGAVIVFQIVKSSLGAIVANRAGPFVVKLSEGFKNDAFNYLLFLRLVPAFPFFAVNAVAGLARVDLRSFVLATFIGIIPGAIAFAWFGRGLGSVIEAQRSLHRSCVAENGLANCPFEFSMSSLLTPQLLLGFFALALVALIPVGLKKWKAPQ